MEQETRKFAIAQAILLISSRQDITDKTKAVFDLADSIVKYIGEPTKVEPKHSGGYYLDSYPKTK